MEGTLNLTSKGYSLQETLIGLFILGAVLNMASTALLGLAPRYRLHQAAWEVHSQLNYARCRALFEGTKFRLKFFSQSYRIEKYDPVEDQWQRDSSNLLEGVTLKANNSPTFHPAGTVSNMATIHVSNSRGSYKITIAISGRIRIQALK